MALGEGPISTLGRADRQSQIRDALVRGELWLATAEGVIQPPKEEAPLSSLGVILDAREAKVWTQRLIDSYGRRGLSLEPMASRPKLIVGFTVLVSRLPPILVEAWGVDLERIADEFDVELDDLEEWTRIDAKILIDQDWRSADRIDLEALTLSFGDRMRNQAGVRSMILQERRRLARRTSKLLVAHLATERSMILRPPRSLRSSGHACFKTRRAAGFIGRSAAARVPMIRVIPLAFVIATMTPRVQVQRRAPRCAGSWTTFAVSRPFERCKELLLTLQPTQQKLTVGVRGLERRTGCPNYVSPLAESEKRY